MAINPAFITCDVCGEGNASPFSFLGTDRSSDPSVQEALQRREMFGNGPQYIISNKTEKYLCKKHREIARRYGLHTVKMNDAINFLDSTMTTPSTLKQWIIRYKNRGKPTPLPGNGTPMPSINQHKHPFINPTFFDCEVCGKSDTMLFYFANRNIEVTLPRSHTPPSNQEMLSMFGEASPAQPVPTASPNLMILHGDTRLCHTHKDEAEKLNLQQMYKKDALLILKSQLQPQSFWDKLKSLLYSIIRIP